MDIPIEATVFCEKDECGQVSRLIINPSTNEITHIVVIYNYIPVKERIVPVKYIRESSPDLIVLACTTEELIEMEPFFKHTYYSADKSYGIFPVKPRVYIPYHSSLKKFADVKSQAIPPGEICFDVGATVEAADGRAGKIEEFLIDSTTEHITHLILEEGHLWNRQKIAIPISEIDHIEKNAVYLRISRDQIKELPPILAIKD